MTDGVQFSSQAHRQRPSLLRREFLARAAAAGAAALGSWSARALPTVGAQSTPAAPVGRGRWMNRARVPFARTEVSVAGLDNRLYLIGGYAHGRVDQPFNQVYDPAADAWRDLAAMPRGLNHVGVVGYNGKIYTFGGFIEQNRTAITDCFEYDVRENRWRRIAPLREKRGAIAVVEVNGKLHLVGGRDEHSLPTHEVYDPATDTWTTMAPMPTPRHGTGAYTMGGAIHIPGGGLTLGGSQPTTVHEAFSPA
jgi:N-acetylneuraminic acid mutarotase